MSIEGDIQQALCAHLASPALAGSPPIAWPLVTYSPTLGTSYLAVQPVLRAETDPQALGFGDGDVYTGIFQVDAVIPDGRGEQVGLTLAALVKDRFPAGTVLSAGGKKLRVNRPPTIAPAVKDAPWVRFPVSVRYFLST